MLIAEALALHLAMAEPARAQPRVTYYRRMQKRKLAPTRPQQVKTIIIPSDGFLVPEGIDFDTRWKLLIE